MSMIQLYGADLTPHHCGYCDKNGSVSYGMSALQLLPIHYQALIDRGWRRSGTYLYKPEMEKTCCKLYTIRLDSLKYSRSKSHKKVMKKMEKYLNGQSTKDMDMDVEDTDVKMINENGLNVEEELKKHKLEITLTRAAFTEESYQVYKKYQTIVHNDPESKINENSYKRFLVDSPITYQNVPTPNHPGYGSFHRHYKIDGKLVAVGVIDILPFCVSSVYFYYDPQYSFLSLGVYSAISEIDFSKELSKIDPPLKYYYLGFYAHNCPKMNYKGQYKPSDLLDYISYKWYPLSECIPLLENSPLSRFERDGNGILLEEKKKEEPTNIKKVPIKIGKNGPLVTLDMLKMNKQLLQLVEEYASRVGPELADQLILSF